MNARAAHTLFRDRERIIKCAALMLALIAIAMLNSCATEPKMSRGIVPIEAGPLAAENEYSFRFVDKWRISHLWLNGPTEAAPCRYPTNAFRRVGGYGGLGAEINTPFVERHGVLYVVSENKGKWSVSDRREWFYGTDRDGYFEGFRPFCSHFFKDTYDGLTLLIVKPDPANGADEWLMGAQSVTINGLQWFRKPRPMRDLGISDERLAASVETLVLKIPETPYWLRLNLVSNSGASNRQHKGADAFPEKHQKIVDLFHRIAESVALEPITPIENGPLISDAR